MSKSLIIAEKPSVAEEIARVIGGFKKTNGFWERHDMIVAHAVGHLVGINFPDDDEKKWELDDLPLLPEKFRLQALGKTEQLLGQLKAQIARADVSVVINACDAGREGELIFGLIAQYARCAKTVKRMWLQSLTPSAIKTAYADLRPGAEYQSLLDCARCRSEADLLIGVNATRALTTMRQYEAGGRALYTIGRVQTPTLALIVDRERAIKHFVPQEFWELLGTFTVESGSFTAKWLRTKDKNAINSNDKPQEIEAEQAQEIESQNRSRITDKSSAQVISARCIDAQVFSAKDVSKPETKNAPSLFDLTTLQREANKRFGLTAAATLEIAQTLYEAKLLTYPRTDCSALPEDYVMTAKRVMEALATKSRAAQQAVAERYVEASAADKRIFNDKKISDHFAIIPTGDEAGAGRELTGNQAKVYDMVVQRFIAAFYPSATYTATTRIIELSSTGEQGSRDTFVATGRVLVRPGWTAVYSTGEDEPKAKSDMPTLAVMKSDEVPVKTAASLKSGKTTPPKRYNDNTLLAAMEGAGKAIEDDELRKAMAENGLGTPATRAAVIEGLLSEKRQYVVREKKELSPTPKGIEIIDLLRDAKIEVLTSAELTGQWEKKLGDIRHKKVSRADFMAEIRQTTAGIVQSIKDCSKIKRSAPSNEPGRTLNSFATKLTEPCPDCGQEVISNSWAYACKSCEFKVSKTIAGRKITEAEAVALMSRKEVNGLQGFISKAEKPFSASLVLRKSDGQTSKVEFSFDK